MLSEQAIAMPLAKLFKGKDIDLKIAKVESFSVDKKEINLADGSTLSYDALVVALGMSNCLLRHSGTRRKQHGIKICKLMQTKSYKHVEDRIREYAKTKNEADATIVIGGGGLTGVELVGELADIMPKLAKSHGVNPKEIKLCLLKQVQKSFQYLPDHLIERATTSLEARGVEFLTGLPVTNVEGNVIDLKDGQKIVANTFVWTGGVQGNPLIGESGLEVNRGRATVNEYPSIYIT